MKAILVVLSGLVLLVGCKKDEKWGVNSFIDVAALRQVCSKEDPRMRAACIYYVIGAVDSYQAHYEVEHGKPWLCGDPTQIDLTNAVVGQLQAHPDVTANTASAFVEESAERAFGCEQKKG